MSRAVTWAVATVALGLVLLVVLLLVPLGKLFCSLLRQRGRSQHLHAAEAHKVPRSPAPSKPLDPSSFPFYAHGVLQAPTSFLLTVPNLEAAAAAQLPSQQSESARQANCGAGDGSYQFVCISNPIYDGACAMSNACGGNATPFETPGTSPSCFGTEDAEEQTECSPPLTVMRKLAPVLPKATAAVFLVDGRRSLATSASVTDTNWASSSCSSNSLCSSPSW